VRSAGPPAAVALVVGFLLLAGCGGGPAQPPPQSSRPDRVVLTPAADGTQSVDVDADDANRFHPSLVAARPGPVRVTLRHVGTGAPHNWAVRELPAARVPLVAAGQSRTVRFVVSRPGDYRFVCTIHESQGQVGRLRVEAAP
jgi:plastocyanin